MSSIGCKYIKRLKKGHTFVKMQYRVMKLDLHILQVCGTSYILSFKQIPVLVSKIFKYMFKFNNIF